MWFVWLGGFPEYEIERVFFDVFDFDTGTGFKIIQHFAGELAVAFEFTHAVVHVAVAGRIGVALFDQRFDQADDVIDVSGGTRLKRWTVHPQCIKIFVHGGGETLYHVQKVFFVFVGAFDDFVVDIGDVAHVIHVITAVTQVSHNQIERQKRTGMTQMTVVIHRHTADVHADLARYHGHEVFFLACEGVEYF